jgi:hypothetical protein
LTPCSQPGSGGSDQTVGVLEEDFEGWIRSHRQVTAAAKAAQPMEGA